METNFTFSTKQKGEKAILYNRYLYLLKRENQNGTHLYVCTFNCCSRTISLKDNKIIKVNGENHNHDPKLPENVQTVQGVRKFSPHVRYIEKTEYLICAIDLIVESICV